MPDERTDDILTRLRADEKAALKDLFQEYYLSVCKTIHRFIRDKSTVEDLAQEVFIRFWEKRQQIEINSSLSAYIRRMAINEALAYLRRNKRFDDREVTPDIVPGTADSTEAQFLQQELEARVREAVNELPPRCRTVFQLSRYEELTYQEIADQMEISIKTVENQMGKALRILRERLRSYLHLFL